VISYGIGLLRVQLLFRGARTLKDRRGPVRSIKDRLRNMGFTVAQVGPPDLLQRVWISAAIVSGSSAVIRGKLKKAQELMYGPEMEPVELFSSIVGTCETLPEWEKV